MSISWDKSGIPSYSSGVEEDAFEGASGIGSFDWGSTDNGTDWSSGFGVDSSGLLGPRSVSTNRSDLTSKALEALNKAIAYQGGSQSARTGGTTASAPSGRVEKINNSLSIIYPGQKQKVTNSGGGGGGIGSAIGTIAGIGASLIPGVGAGIAPFLPQIGGMVGGGIGGAIR